MRARASASATREVSMVIHRRPHSSAAYAVVPEPHVGSSTRSPGSVAIMMHLWTTFVDVWTTYTLSSVNPVIITSRHRLFKGDTGKSSKYRLYINVFPIGLTLVA